MTKWEVQTHTLADGWVNCWHESDETQYFDSRREANAALSEFLRDVAQSDIQSGYDRSDYRIRPVYSPETEHRFELMPAIEAVADMPELAHTIQQAISTPELRELIDYLESLYEPLEG